MDKSMKNRLLGFAAVSSVALLMALSPVQVDLVEMDAGWSQAQAEHSGSHGGKGYRGGGRGGHDSGDEHDHDDSSHSSHNGGRRGHQSNRSPSDATENDVLRGHGRSTRPVWAGGGIPEVELGRLNVSRAPSFVLDRALANAQAELAANPDTEVHSPLANLAMYRDTLKVENLTEAQLEIAAQHLGVAADMRNPISSDTVEALNIILGTGLSLSNTQVTSLAQQADSVRAARLAAHGDEGHTDTEHSQ